MRKKIVHLMGSCGVGGVQKLVLQLACSPEQQGIKHTIVCLYSSNGTFRQEYEKRGIKVILCRLAPPYKGGKGYRVRKILRQSMIFFASIKLSLLFMRIRPDIVHSHLDAQLLHQLLACFFTQTPYLWSIHGEYHLSVMDKVILKYFIKMKTDAVRVTYDSAAAILSTAPFLMAFEKKITLVPTGIDLKQFKDAKGQRRHIRKELGVETDETIVVGSVGRLVRDKGYDLLVDALAIGNNFTKIHVVIAGEGVEEHNILELIKQKKLSNKISMLGLYKDIPALLSGFDIYVQPSRTEGFPLATIEAMAAGLPILAFEAGGLKEMLNDSVGKLVPKEDPKALRDALELLLTDKQQRDIYSERSLRHAANFSIEKTGAMFLDIYKEQLMLTKEKE